jgi:transcriptional regulator with XRE-family HTH domain
MRPRAEPNRGQFPAALTRARIEADITKTELARLLGIARSTAHAYETGARRPSRDRIASIAKALKLSTAATDELLAVAGFEPQPDKSIRAMERRQKTVTQATDQISQLPWVALVVNELNEIVGWNGLATEVSQLDFANDTPNAEDRNFAILAAMPHFRERLENWHELIGRLLAIWKINEGDILASDTGYFGALL